jgi:hypothetical protein
VLLPFRPGTALLVLPLLLPTCPAYAQPTFPLAGIVTNATTGEPLPRARVFTALLSGPADQRRVIFTDPSGAFRFPALPAGQYSVYVEKPGFAPNSFTSRQPIRLNEPVENLAYALVPFGVISGQLLDADGEPIPLVKVQLYRSSFTEGRAIMEQVRSATTDDRGQFRFPRLSAGRYLVRAVSRAGGAFLSGDESAPPSVGRRAFAPVYAGNAEQATQATPTDLAPGQQVQLDFRLPFLPAARIRGVLAGLRPGAPVFFELQLPGREPIEPRVFLNPASGVFTIFDLLPATYQLRVRLPRGFAQLYAEATVTAGVAPPPLHLELRDVPSLHLQVQGPGTSSCSVVLLPSVSTRALPLNPTVHSPVAAPPGEYDVRANCFDVAIESLFLGSTDLLLSRRVTIPPGPSAVILILTRSSHDAKLLIHRPDPVRSAAVLLVPAAEALGVPTLHEFGGLRQAILPLLPGDYTLYALPSAAFPYRDPAFLAKLRGGVNVRVEPGRTVSATLTEVTQP